MDILVGLAGFVVGVAIAWQLAQDRASAEISRLRTQLEERIGYWQGETERARASAAQLSEKTAAWVAGCRQGREDLLGLTRALSQGAPGADGDPAAS